MNNISNENSKEDLSVNNINKIIENKNNNNLNSIIPNKDSHTINTNIINNNKIVLKKNDIYYLDILSSKGLFKDQIYYDILELYLFECLEL